MKRRNFLKTGVGTVIASTIPLTDLLAGGEKSLQAELSKQPDKEDVRLFLKYGGELSGTRPVMGRK